MINVKPEFGLGGLRTVTHYEAANAIFNKLQLALLIAHSGEGSNEQLVRAITESIFLSDAIVREQDPPCKVFGKCPFAAGDKGCEVCVRNKE